MGWRVTSIEPASDGTLTAGLTGGDCFQAFDGTSIRLPLRGALIGDGPGTPLSAVCHALRPERLRTIDGLASYAQGREIAFRFDLVNRSSRSVSLPLVDYDGSPYYYAAGTIQTWPERLGAPRRSRLADRRRQQHRRTSVRGERGFRHAQSGVGHSWGD